MINAVFKTEKKAILSVKKKSWNILTYFKYDSHGPFIKWGMSFFNKANFIFISSLLFQILESSKFADAF